MNYPDLHSDDGERVVIYVSCSEPTFIAWAGDDDEEGAEEGFAEGYDTYEAAVQDAVSTWRDFRNSFTREARDGAEHPGDEKTIYIRCSPGTRTKFKEFAAGYEDYESAIEDIARTWRGKPNLFAKRAQKDRAP